MVRPKITPMMRAAIRTGMHPIVFKSMGPSSRHPNSTYDPRMAPYLPAPSDARKILDFFGLNAEASSRVLQALGPAKLASLPAKYLDPEGEDWWRFPLADTLLDTYIHTAPRKDPHLPATFEGFYAAALQQGLRPEFACTVALHEEDPRFPIHEEYYERVDPDGMSREEVVTNMYILFALWKDRMKREGEASIDAS